jgi:hypothetical protein
MRLQHFLYASLGVAISSSVLFAQRVSLPVGTTSLMVSWQLRDGDTTYTNRLAVNLQGDIASEFTQSTKDKTTLNQLLIRRQGKPLIESTPDGVMYSSFAISPTDRPPVQWMRCPWLIIERMLSARFLEQPAFIMDIDGQSVRRIQHGETTVTGFTGSKVFGNLVLPHHMGYEVFVNAPVRQQWELVDAVATSTEDLVETRFSTDAWNLDYLDRETGNVISHVTGEVLYNKYKLEQAIGTSGGEWWRASTIRWTVAGLLGVVLGVVIWRRRLAHR